MAHTESATLPRQRPPMSRINAKLSSRSAPMSHTIHAGRNTAASWLRRRRRSA